MPRQGWEPKHGSSPLAALVLLLFLSIPNLGHSDPSAPAAQDIDLRLPADIVYQSHVGPDSAVSFRHSTHVEMAGRKCTGCHPRPFLMLSPTHRTSHLVMNAGGSCGSCHDGKHAFGVRDASSCRSCHSGRAVGQEMAAGRPGKHPGEATPAGSGPQPILYARSDASPGRVTFRHETHLRGQQGCVSCHPKLFRMKALASAAADMHQGQACGKCHNGAKAFGVEDPEKCARCHVAAKGTP